MRIQPWGQRSIKIARAKTDKQICLESSTALLNRTQSSTKRGVTLMASKSELQDQENPWTSNDLLLGVNLGDPRSGLVVARRCGLLGGAEREQRQVC